MMMYRKTAMQYSKLVADVLQNVCRLSVVGCCYNIDRKGHYLSISVSADFLPTCDEWNFPSLSFR